MPEIALSSLKKDEERDLILLILMQVIKEQGGLFVIEELDDNMQEFELSYELMANDSVVLKLQEKS